MLLIHFFSQNLHFAINLLAGLVCFATVWLYADAWSVKKETKELLKWLGFLCLGTAFVIQATQVESVFGTSLLGTRAGLWAEIVRLVGYVLLLGGLMIDPLQPKPHTEGLKLEHQDKPKSKTLPGLIPSLAIYTVSLPYLLVLSSAGVCLLYVRRATLGLERHLRRVALAFVFFFGAEVYGLFSRGQTSNSIIIRQATAPFGVVWNLEHGCILIGTLILGSWVWQYLVRRLQSQLTLVFTLMVVVVFLVSTVSFTYLLMQTVQDDALRNLQISSNVLTYALHAKQAETLAEAEGIAQDKDLASALTNKDRAKLTQVSNSILATKKLSSLIFTGEGGEVILRGEDTNRWGDSLSDNSLIQRVVTGDSASSVVAKDGPVAPLLQLQSVAPVRDASNSIVGTVLISVTIDNAFVDGIKQATGLDTSVYSQATRVATTFVGDDGTSRLTGINETNKQAVQQVLHQGQNYRGDLSLLNTPYLVNYAPLRDIDTSIVGMLFIGKPYVSVLQTMGRAIQVTYSIAVLLLLLSLAPIYKVSRYLANQLQ